MKLVSYKSGEGERLGVFTRGTIFNLHACNKAIPDNMKEFLQAGPDVMDRAIAIDARIKDGSLNAKAAPFYELLAPVPQPASFRDGYAFRQHVEAARRNRGLEMIPEYELFPVFYFSNHQAIQGPGEVLCMPDHFAQLDFELELAVVLNKKGRNIPAAEADSYIAGYMIMNDLSARRLQREEMKLSLGPAKGKDFATVTGPWLVTPDELLPYEVAPPPGHTGACFALEMKCWVNDRQVSAGSSSDMNWTFAEIIERCSYGVDMFPGDIIGSGTVGTGCFLELNGTGKLRDAAYPEQWLRPGDRVEMEITGLGRLSSTMVSAAERR